MLKKILWENVVESGKAVAHWQIKEFISDKDLQPSVDALIDLQLQLNLINKNKNSIEIDWKKKLNKNRNKISNMKWENKISKK